MNKDAAIQVTDLHKSFSDLKAVDGVDFSIRAGETLSLLGPNGAGKSTTISMICGLIKPDQGDASILGHSILSEPQAARRSLGVVPQEIALYPDLTARENLAFWGRMFGLSGGELKARVESVLERIGLTGRQNGKVGTFSGGMKRRLNIAVALLHEPQALILDEPTVGIDPQSRRHILDWIQDLHEKGVSILYTTHYMEEAAELSDRIAIMDAGKIIAQGTHAELIRLVGENTRIDLKVDTAQDEILAAWKGLPGVVQADRQDGTISVLTPDSNRVLPALFESAGRLNVRIGGMSLVEPNLETVFLHLTGKALRD
jgi:ABC-2 type transport system ATP-binding protein